MAPSPREAAQFGLRRAPVHALPRLHQIVLPTPWMVGPVQVYLVEGDPVTLIDTGVRTRESRVALESALDALGLGLGDVERIVLTHFHGDHLGQAQTIRDAGMGAEVWVHEDDAEMCELFSAERDERIEETELLFREHGVPDEVLARQTAMRREWLREDPLCGATRVDQRLRGGDRIPFKDFELEVIHAPGHTPGHLLLYEESSGTLVSGDHLMGNAVPFTDNFHLDAEPDPTDPLRRRPRFRGLTLYLDSLRRLRGGTFRTILPAHGGVIECPARAIDEALLFYEVRVQRIERALRRRARKGGGATAWEVWLELFPRADRVREMRNRMLMVIGGLDVLEDQGRARTHRRAGGCLEHRPL